MLGAVLFVDEQMCIRDRLNTDEVKVNVIHSGVGAVSESDVMLASASNAIILGFNIIAPPAALSLIHIWHEYRG